MDLAKITRLARKRFHQVVGNSNLKNVPCPIACYIDETCYQAVCDDELAFFEHWALLALFGEMIAKHGAIVIFVPIVPADYFRWLKKLNFENTPQSRARYVNWLMSGTIEGPGGQIDEPKE
jgi:hypothetical protein